MNPYIKSLKVKKICPRCGAIFFAHPKIKYCSYDCKVAKSQIPHICEYCGKEFITKYSQQRFCNRQCRYMSMRKEVICPKCGKKRTVWNCYDGKGHCSLSCARKGNINAKRVEKVKGACIVCGKEFMDYSYVYPYRDMRRKFCSRECYYKQNPGLKKAKEVNKLNGKKIL